MNFYVNLPNSFLTATDGNRLHETIQQNAFIQKRNSYSPEKCQVKHSYAVRNLPEKPDYEPKLFSPQYQRSLYRNDDLYDQEKL